MTKPAATITPTGTAPVFDLTPPRPPAPPIDTSGMPDPSRKPIVPKLEAVPARRSDLDSDTEMVILPDPVGHFMLIALPTMAEQTAKGVYIPTAVNERERAASVVGTVLAQGPSCYKDRARFPDGAWCKVGDKVLFSRYQGSRFKSKDLESGEMVEYRMLADDAIVGTVPEGADVGGL